MVQILMDNMSKILHVFYPADIVLPFCRTANIFQLQFYSSHKFCLPPSSPPRWGSVVARRPSVAPPAGLSFRFPGRPCAVHPCFAAPHVPGNQTLFFF